METFTTVFGWTSIFVFILAILIPTLYRGADLLTVRNAFLLGGVLFVGMAALSTASGTSPIARFRLKYTTSDYLWYYAGIILFYLCFFAAYHRGNWTDRIAGRSFLRWPGVSPNVLLLIVPFVLAMSLLRVFQVPIPVLYQLSFLLGDKLAIIATVLALFAWWQERSNPILLVLFIVAVVVALGLGLFNNTGRRNLVALLVAVPIALYWLRWRYLPAKKIVASACAAGFVALLLLVGYGAMRHSIRNEEGVVNKTVAAVTGMPWAIMSGNWDSVLEHDTMDVSLIAIHLYGGPLEDEVSHFASLKFIAINPIPRVFWSDKPKGLGWLLPQRDYPSYTGVRLWGGSYTWGAGVVGHAWHEGGLLMAGLYGLLAGIGIRFADALLQRQPNNPFLLGLFAASFGHVVGWVRGDLGTFTIQIIASILAGALISVLARTFFGTALLYSDTSHVAGDEFSRATIRRRLLGLDERPVR